MSDELNFENEVMAMNVKKIETSHELTPKEFEDKIFENLNVSYLKSICESLDVHDESSASTALSMSLQAKKIRQQLDDSRKEIVKPHFDYQKAINKIVKDVENKLEQIEENLKDKINKWNEKRKEMPFESHIDLEIRVDDGVLYTQKKWEFNIDDSSLIPREYMIVDDRKIKEAISNGIRNIPGVDIYEKHELVMRIKN